MFNFYIPFYASINSTFKYYLRRRFRDNYRYIAPYEDRIAILASFLFISSSFMLQIKKEQYFDFKWQSCFRIYKFGALHTSSICSIRYLLDVMGDIPNRNLIEESIPGLRDNFVEQYRDTIVEQHRKHGENVVDVNKQMAMMGLVLKVYQLYQYDLPKEPRKVLDLVKYLTQWKEIALEVFKYKAEYVLFSFLVNLSR